MNCPDWRLLLTERDRAERSGGLTDTPAWRAAVGHLADCAACRGAAFELDPALLFVAHSPIEVSDEEVDRIQANVHVLRRARSAERASAEPRRRIARFASAAAVISLMILLPTHTARPPSAPLSASGPNLASEMSPFAGGLSLGDGPAPLIEPLDLPAARIYQLGEGDLSVVMVVDESIDV